MATGKRKTDHQSYQYHQRNDHQQNWNIDRWLTRLQISRSKLEQHPYFDDVVTLLMFDDWQQYMNQSDRAIWRHCWQWSYHREFPLSDYHQQQLINIITGIEYRQQAFQQRQLKRQHIQARRQARRQQLAAV